MKLAEPKHAKEIYKAFMRRKDIFPHIRKDYLERMILEGQCVFQDGVVITFQQYLKSVKLGTIVIPKSSFILHQILNTNQFNGNAGKVFEQFCSDIDGPLYLAVRSDNKIARSFYERHKMKAVGTISWSNDTLAGTLYFRECTANLLI